jgi:hypothetical protein
VLLRQQVQSICRGVMLELWVFVLVIAALLLILAAIVLWEAFRQTALVPKHGAYVSHSTISKAVKRSGQGPSCQERSLP